MIGAVPPDYLHNVDIELDGPQSQEKIERFNEELKRLVESYGGRMKLKRRQVKSQRIKE